MSVERNGVAGPDMACDCVVRHAAVLRSKVRAVDLQLHGLDPDDIEQEARLRLWSAQRRSPARPLPAKYAARAAASSALDAIRRESSRMRGRHQDISLMATEIAHPDLTPEAECEREQWMQALNRCLQRLPARRRNAIVRFLQGYSLTETAEVTGLSINACSKLVQRGLVQLRGWIAGNASSDSI